MLKSAYLQIHEVVALPLAVVTHAHVRVAARFAARCQDALGLPYLSSVTFDVGLAVIQLSGIRRDMRRECSGHVILSLIHI